MAEISKTTDQALAVLLELSDNGPMTAAALARALRLNRTVVHRLLTTLHRRGFVTRTENGYAPGAILMRIAERVQPELRAAAHAVLNDLAGRLDETIVLHVADGTDAVVLDQVVAQSHVLRVEHRIGSRHPLHTAASGRALLAFLGPAATDRALKGAENVTTIQRELEGVRSLGYAMSHDELQEGVHGLAVPVLTDPEHAIASVAVLVPTKRATAVMSHLDDLQDGARRIATSLTGGAAEPLSTASALS
jgi:IclR family transcriptional regulator, KDG regulon repressor